MLTLAVQYLHQGNINCKGTVTFANEPKLEKLLRELKPMPDLYYKKMSHVCNGKFAAFWVLFLRDNL